MKNKLLGLNTDMAESDNIESQIVKKLSTKDIAIIGVALRLPMALNMYELYENIIRGVDCITDIPESRKADIDKFLKHINMPQENIKFGKASYLEHIDQFDNDFFGFSPNEATFMDPNQRLFLEVAHEAIEDAGYGGEKMNGSKTGVYLAFNSQKGRNFEEFLGKIGIPANEIAFAGNVPPIIASRISYLLDLRGPSLLVDTACSSSLVAVHLACQSLRTGDCEMAIAGGITLNFLPLDIEKKTGIESSDGLSRTFDDSSDGTGTGEGVIAILLKPLYKALQDNDNIHAVIRGSSINQDGRSIGITAPNPVSQGDLIIEAWKDARVDPETISYIEAHGTGTKLGDPIEIEGIQRAFTANTSKRQFCGIGSIKTNIGHLDVTAGLAGLVKMIMALKTRELPPILHFKMPNRKIDFQESPVYVCDRRSKWETENYPRRCGVSSFGLNGTNCHVIMEEFLPEKCIKLKDSSKVQMLMLSAKNETVLGQLISDYLKFIEKNTHENLEDICYTANSGRGHYECRLAIIVYNLDDLQKKINELNDSGFKNIKTKGIFYGVHKIIVSNRQMKNNNEITENDKRNISKLVDEKVKAFVETHAQNETLADEICQMYVKGADVNWEQLYKNEKRKKVCVPVYPLQRKRCWPEIKPLSDTGKGVEESNLYNKVEWVLCKKEQDINTRIYPYDCIVVIKDSGGLADEVIKLLKDQGRSVIEVSLGFEYRKFSTGVFTIGSDGDAYDRLLEEIKTRKIAQIIHMSSSTLNEPIGSAKGIEERLDKGLYSLFYLFKAISASGIKGTIDVVLISNYANQVTCEEKSINPENSALFGLAKVVGMENQNLRCKCIDIDEYVSADTIISEIHSGFEQFQVAYRQGKKYNEILSRLHISELQEDKIHLKREGVYIITGGTGGIGLEIASYLADREKINLALINRTKMPEREKWNKILEDGNDSKLCKKIEALRRVESTGVIIEYFNADVSEENELKPVIENLRERYGRVNGVIHCAGIASDILMCNKNIRDFTEVIRPKIQGTWLIDKLTVKDTPDFFIMFSSAITIFSMRGHGDYTAANSYLDAYAAFRKNRGRTIALDWAGWKETGMGVGYIKDKVEGQDNGMFKSLTTVKAINAFDELIQKNISRVCIGEFNEVPAEYADSIFGLLKIDISNELKGEILKRQKLGETEITQDPKNSNIKISGRDDGKYTETERKIVKIWSEIFGYDEININDGFFEIGGHSLLAIKLEAEMEIYGMPVESTDIYEYPTVSQMAEFIDSREV